MAIYYSIYLTDGQLKATLITVAVLYGVSLAAVSTALLSFPMVWQNYFGFPEDSWNRRIGYGCCISLMFIMYNNVQATKEFLILSESAMITTWWICKGFHIAFIALGLLYTIYVMITQTWRFEIAGPETLLLDSKAELAPLFEKEEKPTQKLIRKLFWSGWKLSLDIAIFICIVVILFTASGGFNLVLYFGNNVFFNQPSRVSGWEAFFLPTMMIACVISIRLTYSNVLNKNIGLFTFKNIRRLFQYERKRTIAEKLTSVHRFSVVTKYLREKHSKLWEDLKNPYLRDKILLKVWPDDRESKKPDSIIYLKEHTHEFKGEPNVHEVEYFMANEYKLFVQRVKELRRATLGEVKELSNGCLVQFQPEPPRYIKHRSIIRKQDDEEEKFEVSLKKYTQCFR